MKRTKHWTACLLLSASTACMPLPLRVGSRGPIEIESLAFLRAGRTSRQEVLLHLGRPESTSRNQTVFDYKWIGGLEWFIGGMAQGAPAAGTYQVQECHVLRLEFDEEGTLRSLRKWFYRPDAELGTNRQCGFGRNPDDDSNELEKADRLVEFPEGPRTLQGGLFLAGSRTWAHASRSDQAVYAKITSELVSDLRSRGVVFANGPAGMPQIDQPVLLYRLLDLARAAGADRLLLVTLDRPLFSWVAIAIRCYDLSGALLWEESAGSGFWSLTGGQGLASALGEIRAMPVVCGQWTPSDRDGGPKP